MEIIVRVVEKLGPLIKKEVDLHLNSDHEAKTLANNLEKIQLLLDDAERKQMSQPLVKKWLQDLQDLAYNIADALEVWEAQNEALQQQEESINSSPATTWMEKVCHFLHYPCSCFNKVVERRTVALDINGLNESVVGMYTHGVDQLQLIHLITSLAASHKVESVGSSSSYNWRSTTSDYIKSDVHGRETDAENVKMMLLSGDDLGEKQEVVCIVGGGGLGKTTLAKMIYDDDEVVRKFPKRIWVCVSDPFNEKAIATEIYEQLEGQKPTVSGLQSIKKKIKESLRKKSEKFLLVLDDVWTQNSQEWKPLQACLSQGAEGSKILLTTRKEKTAKAVGATENRTYSLQGMSPEDCWSIICQKAFQGKEANPGLEKIGREIAKKCNGSPLAANFLGGHLQDKKTLQEWKRVQESEVWKLENVEEELFRHFFLSYNELKPAAKHCFAYCAVFPKDHVIEVEDLIKLWKAQGFASPTNASLATEHDCFKDLAQRSFFQDLRKDELTGEIVKTCKMHDIVHDFALYLNTNARHVWGDGMFAPQPFNNSDVEKLRSLICRGGLPAEDIIRRLKCVRALSLYYCGLLKIPDEIGNLIHLRYLDLSGNFIAELPETICNLRYLQALLLLSCWNLSKLPKGISKLRKLRYLICDDSMENFDYTCEIESLTDLQQLPFFYVGEGCNDLRYLKDLDKLEGSLFIKLSDVEDVESAQTAALWKKTSLEILTLVYDESVKSQVVDALRPHSQLQSLEIRVSFALNLRLPGWISDLDHLGSLVIHGNAIEDGSGINLINELENITNEYGSEDELEYIKNKLEFDSDYESERLSSEILSVYGRFPSVITFLENYKRLSTELRNLKSEILEEDEEVTDFGERWISVRRNLRIELTAFENSINDFPPLWKLQSLEFLGISGDYCVQSFVSSVSSFSYDENVVAFPALKTLELCGDDGWGEWNETEEAVTISGRFMPLLTELYIYQCYNLKSLPERTLQQLPSLRTLCIHGCWGLEDKYPREAWTPKLEVIVR